MRGRLQPTLTVGALFSRCNLNASGDASTGEGGEPRSQPLSVPAPDNVGVAKAHQTTFHYLPAKFHTRARTQNLSRVLDLKTLWKSLSLRHHLDCLVFWMDAFSQLLALGTGFSKRCQKPESQSFATRTPADQCRVGAWTVGTFDQTSGHNCRPGCSETSWYVWLTKMPTRQDRRNSRTRPHTHGDTGAQGGRVSPMQRRLQTSEQQLLDVRPIIIDTINSPLPCPISQCEPRPKLAN